MPIFDPETGKVLDAEALRSLQFNGQGMRVPATTITPDGHKRVEIIDDDNGRTMGHQTYHGSGRVDANVTPETVNVASHTQE